MALPMAVLFQVLGHMFRDQDMPGITAIHHPLRDVDSGTRNVGATTYVHHATDRPALNSHAHLQPRMFACSAADLERAFHWSFRRYAEIPPHAFTGRNRD